MTKSKKLNIQQLKDWLEKQAAICRIGKGRLECVIDINHIEPCHFAALYAVPSPSELHIIELSEYFPSEAAAWQALEDFRIPTHPAVPVVEWMKEQYLTDKNARVERFDINK